MEGLTDAPARPEDVRAVYDAAAAAYDAHRSRALYEARWLVRFAAGLPAGGRVLDLGCGTGDPIATWFATKGFAVTGADFSPAMLEIARARRPSGDWRLADIRTLDLGETFDGIVAWNSVFHLTPDDQRAALPRLARHLAPGGALLMTVGASAEESQGDVAGRAVYHASLSHAAYAAALEACGMILTGFLAEDPDTNRHSVLMARKT